VHAQTSIINHRRATTMTKIITIVLTLALITGAQAHGNKNRQGNDHVATTCHKTNCEH
jgi:hypothetical protein